MHYHNTVAEVQPGNAISERFIVSVKNQPNLAANRLFIIIIECTKR